MIDLQTLESIYLVQGSTDLRKGIDGYASIVSGELDLDPFSKSIFMFCNRNKDKVKILYWDGNGFWLFYKRLEQGKFRWILNEEGALELSHQQLRWLFEGLDIEHKRAFKAMKDKVI